MSTWRICVRVLPPRTARVDRLPLSCRKNRRPWCSSGSITENGAGSKPLPSAFPWRSTPHGERNGLIDRLWHKLVVQSRNQRLPFLKDPAFLPAAEVAFIQVAAAAFQMRASRLRAPLGEVDGGGSAGGDSDGPVQRQKHASMPNSIVVAPIPELVEDEDIVDPRDVMHEDLADFYINAGATTNVARCTAVYRLHEVMNSRISNIKFNVWKLRSPGDNDPRDSEGKAEEEVKGWKHLVMDVSDLAKWQLTQPDGMHRSMKSTVLVDVDIMCRETFFVVDDVTHQVVQGNKAIDKRIHRLRLEAAPARWNEPDFRWLLTLEVKRCSGDVLAYLRAAASVLELVYGSLDAVERQAVDLDHWMKGSSLWD